MVFDIRVEPGVWGLPSLCPEDTAALLLLKFSGIPMELEELAELNYRRTPIETTLFRKDVPPEADGMLRVRGFGEVYDALEARQVGPNARLSDIQRAESRAFISMVSSRFGTAVLYEAWAVEKNFFSGTASAYASTLPWILRPFLPKARHTAVKHRLHQREEDIYDDAARCIHALEARLGSHLKFFYGSQPSALDAVSFAYVSFALRAPCPRLHSLLRSAPNLVALMQRIGDKYCPPFAALPDLSSEAFSSDQNEDSTSQKQRRSSAANSPQELLPDEKQRRRWNRYFLGACAASFVGYFLVFSDKLIEFQGEDQV